MEFSDKYLCGGYNPVMADGKIPGKILAVDWGSKRIGLAISDETQTLARPLHVLEHISRAEDARRVIEAADQDGASLIIVGVTYSDENELSPSGRSAQRLAAEIEMQASIKLILWDEEFSTNVMKETMILTGSPRSKRSGHSDDKAAAIILQSYLDSNK